MSPAGAFCIVHIHVAWLVLMCCDATGVCVWWVFLQRSVLYMQNKIKTRNADLEGLSIPIRSTRREEQCILGDSVPKGIFDCNEKVLAVRLGADNKRPPHSPHWGFNIYRCVFSPLMCNCFETQIFEWPGCTRRVFADSARCKRDMDMTAMTPRPMCLPSACTCL